MSVRALRRGTMAGRGVVLPSTTNVLRLPTATNYVSTPDSAGNSITGSIDMRIKAALTNWSTSGAYLMNKYESTAATRSWRWLFFGDGSMNLGMYDSGGNFAGATSTAPVAFTAAEVGWVRVTWDQSTSAVKFYTSTDGSSWPQLGSDRTIGHASIRNGTSELAIGDAGTGGGFDNFDGDLYYAELRNGIDGTVVQSFDATAVTKIGTRDPSTVAAGGPWTVNGSAWDWEAVA